MSPETIELMVRGRLAMEAAEAASRESAALCLKMQDAKDAVAWTAKDMAAMRLFSLRSTPGGWRSAVEPP